jgi:hypothetical protein
MWPSSRLLPWGVLVATLVLALRLEQSGVARPIEVALTPLVPDATPCVTRRNLRQTGDRKIRQNRDVARYHQMYCGLTGTLVDRDHH